MKSILKPVIYKYIYIVVFKYTKKKICADDEVNLYLYLV